MGFFKNFGGNFVDDVQKTANQLTGNIPKAILCVPDISKDEELTVDKTIDNSDNLRRDLIENGSGQGVMASFKNLANRGTTGTIEKRGYLALEVQYNPSSIYLETVAGTQMNFSPVNMGDASTNQLRQNHEPEATTMSVQLLFDAVNVYDSFMLSNMSLNASNLVPLVTDLAHSGERKYTVKPQMDGIMSLLTRTYTRHVLFFWAKMCFQGELCSVSSHYTMFNTVGNPVRGEIRLTIRQSQDPAAKYENSYWEKAFTKAFGESNVATVTQSAGRSAGVLNNSILNLNL